jgi:hypothetical protein
MDDGRARSATKSDLLDLEEKLGSELLQRKTEIVETIHVSQTQALKAFYSFGQTVQDRFQEFDQTEASLKRRLTVLESRILEIEKHLNLLNSTNLWDKHQKRIEKARKAARARWDKERPKPSEN